MPRLTLGAAGDWTEVNMSESESEAFVGVLGTEGPAANRKVRKYKVRRGQ